MAENITNFPKQGGNKKISLRNSNYKQFDRSYAESLKENYPDIWKRGGNIRGDEAFTLWGKARSGSQTQTVLDWIKEREAWAARHYKNKNIAGVIAQVKWGVVGSRGIGYMKNLINDEKEKIDNKKSLEGGVRVQKKQKFFSDVEKPYILDKDRRIVKFKASNGDYDSDNDRININTWTLRKGCVFIDGHKSGGTVDNILGEVLRGYVEKNFWMNDVKFNNPTVDSEGNKRDPATWTEGEKLANSLWEKILKGQDIRVSVGFLYNPEKISQNEKGGYDFNGQEQYELSAVIVAANTVAGLKNLKEKSFSIGDQVKSEVLKKFPDMKCYVCDIYTDYVIVNVWGKDTDKYYRFNYTVENETVILSDSYEEVEGMTVWVKKELEKYIEPYKKQIKQLTEAVQELQSKDVKKELKSIFKKKSLEKFNSKKTIEKL